MKIIISPSKTQDRNPKKVSDFSSIISPKKTEYLFNTLHNYSKNQMADLMNIQNQLLEDTYALYQKALQDLPKIPAIHLYQGVVFEQIKLAEMDLHQQGYMNQHLVILSAMYGPLKPDTLIWPYRLDMTMKPKNMNLYQYWQEVIDAYFDDDLIINLASNEFSRMIKKQKKNMITIDFKNRSENGKLKTISYYAKMARGKMVHQIILQQVNDIETIKTFNIDGYQYDAHVSKPHHFIFVK